MHQNYCIWSGIVFEEGLWKGFCSFYPALSCSWGAVHIAQKSGWREFPVIHSRVSFHILLCSRRLELMKKSFYVNVRHVAITSHNGIVMATSTIWFLCFCDVAACFTLWVFSFLVLGWTHWLPSWAWALAFTRGRTEGESGKLTEWYYPMHLLIYFSPSTFADRY